MDSVSGWFFEELNFIELKDINNMMVKNNRNRLTYDIPNEGGIYIYYNKDKIPIYVGKARNLRSRHSQHMNDSSCKSHKPLVDECRYYSYSIVTDILKRNVYEMLYIGKYAPKINSSRDTGID